MTLPRFVDTMLLMAMCMIAQVRRSCDEGNHVMTPSRLPLSQVSAQPPNATFPPSPFPSPRNTTDPPEICKCDFGGCCTAILLFKYDPSIPLAIAFAVIFFVLSVIQFVEYYLYRPCGYMLMLGFTALIFECVGYIVRIITVHRPEKGDYIISLLLILLAPILTAYVNYSVTGKMVELADKQVGWFAPVWIARIFVTSDIATFLIQGIGGAMTISDNITVVNAGKNIVTAGLAVQLASFCLFIFIALSIQFLEKYELKELANAQKIFWGIHLTMVMLIVRTVYRLIQFQSGATGYATTHEWTFYVFDSSAMVIAFIVYSWPDWHFGRCFNELQKDFPKKMQGIADDGPDGVLANIA
jgi:hypothetical protein